jgi:AraC-like DNA-binding protein
MDALFSEVRLSNYPAGLIMPTHSHAEASLSLVLSGSYEERIRGRHGAFDNGFLLVCPSFEPHAQCFGPSGVSKIVFTPTEEGIGRLGEAIQFGDAPAVQSRALAELGRRFAHELHVCDDFSALVMSGLSHELVGLTAREQARRGGALPARLRRAMEMIRELDDTPLSMATIARAVGADAGDLARSFRAHLGCTPGDYHRQSRVERAAQLLVTTRQSLADIASACGFSDQPHMTRAFKAHLGLTPGAWRRTNA